MQGASSALPCEQQVYEHTAGPPHFTSGTECIAFLLSKSGHESCAISVRGMGDIMRRLIPAAGVMAFLTPFDRAFAFITEGDPIVKVLLGAGVIFFVWLFLLWDDLVQSK